MTDNRIKLKIFYWGKDAEKKLKDFLDSRKQGIPDKIINSVKKVIEDIKNNGDGALVKYTHKFDAVKLSPEKFLIPQKEINKAYKSQSAEFKTALEKISKRIEDFHKRFLVQSKLYSDEYGSVLGKLVIPVEKAGCYVPGGTAPYPSTVLMTVIPARVAGVKDITVCTPPQKNGQVDQKTLAALSVVNPDRVFRVGGAQAIAAMAFGTQTFPGVDIIVGPGNIYVAAAKKLIFGKVGIDMIAGPSEVAIIADNTSNPEWLASDMMAQSEHDPNTCSFLISPDEKIIKSTQKYLTKLVPESNRSQIIEESLSRNSLFIKVESLKDAIVVSNLIAPEHLELEIKNPFDYLKEIKFAGAVFLGSLTAASFGDYVLGPNHTLPTQSTARFSSALSCSTFLREISVAGISKEGILNLYPHLKQIASAEGFLEHNKSAKKRYDELREKENN